MTKQVEDWIPTRHSLLHRLKDWDDRSSWEDFFNTYWRLIYNVALQSGLTEVEAQEVVQETIINVAKQMPTFRYDRSKGSFKGWLLKTTQWRIGDQFRKRGGLLSVNVESEDNSEHIASRTMGAAAADLNSKWEELWRENLLEVGLTRVKERADPREFQMFDLCVTEGWDVRSVARKLNVTRAHVYYARHKISRLIRKEIEKVEKETAR